MKTPDVSCQIDAYCSINPTEDPKKVEQAITNILVDVDVKIYKESLKATNTIPIINNLIIILKPII